MNLRTDQREIETPLTTFSQKVSGEAERVQWYTEFHPSTHYRLSGVLVFTPAESREQELAAASVQLNDQTGWMFDATDQASIIVAEASVAGSAVRPFSTRCQRPSTRLSRSWRPLSKIPAPRSSYGPECRNVP